VGVPERFPALVRLPIESGVEEVEAAEIGVGLAPGVADDRLGAGAIAVGVGSGPARAGDVG
jgi:hypothetical protein